MRAPREQVFPPHIPRGEGALIEEINEAISQLKASGEIAANVQPVIVVVREKPRSTGFPRMR